LSPFAIKVAHVIQNWNYHVQKAAISSTRRCQPDDYWLFTRREWHRRKERPVRKQIPGADRRGICKGHEAVWRKAFREADSHAKSKTLFDFEKPPRYSA